MALWGFFTLYLTVAAAFLRLRAVTIVLALLTISQQQTSAGATAY